MIKKEEIIRLLKETDDYVSGQELCEHFGVSRTAVWKAIKQLEKDGYTIEAVNNRGYRLQEATDVMSKLEIEANMETSWVARNLYFHKETGSTNLDVKELAEQGAPDGTLVVADKQTAGRGRRGRAWVSPSGEAIYMSLLLRPACNPDRASSLTLVMALAVVEAVEEIVPHACGIKWPNDVVMNGKKICGILTEMSAELDAIHYVVVGIGINANQPSFEGELADRATSLLMETGHKLDRSRFIARVMYFFEKEYEIFTRTYDISGLTETYNRYLLNRGRRVRVLDPKGEYEGEALCVNEQGELLVKKDDGETVAVYAGEVSVRGIYGYV